MALCEPEPLVTSFLIKNCDYKERNISLKRRGFALLGEVANRYCFHKDAYFIKIYKDPIKPTAHRKVN